jgi:hypothetical protein
MRRHDEIQFVPLDPAPVPPRRPGWFDHLMEWLAQRIAPFGQWLAAHWRTIEIVAGLAAMLVLAALAWRFWHDRERRARGDAAREPDWRPDAALARALLADADALAAAGRFDEAAHLLLRRSFEDIAETRPDWLIPASTAREIARLPALPDAARAAFGVIAGEVERSRYALHPLGNADWTRARAAYARFAVPA